MHTVDLGITSDIAGHVFMELLKILGGTQDALSGFSKEIFNVARNTEQSFAVVADAALLAGAI